MADANIAPEARAEEIAALKGQMEEMRRRLEELTAEPSVEQHGEVSGAYDHYAQSVYVANPYYDAPVVRAKDHVAACLLGVFLGMFGVHKFYLGYNVPGFIMLGITVLGGLVTFGLAASVMWLIGVIEGLIYLLKPQQDFEQTYVRNKKYWF